MTKTFKRIIITAIVLIALAGAACALVMSGGCTPTAGDPLADAKNGFVNAALDVSGIKSKVDSELRSKAGALAEETGIPRELVEDVIDSIDIQDWQATALPEDANPTGAFSLDAEGTTLEVTTYDDPSIVTVGAYGQELTMAVPESAQSYLSLLSSLNAT